MTDDDWELHKSYATGRWIDTATRAVLEEMATLHVNVYEQQFLHELCIYSQTFVDIMYSILPFGKEDCSSEDLDFILDVQPIGQYMYKTEPFAFSFSKINPVPQERPYSVVPSFGRAEC